MGSAVGDSGDENEEGKNMAEQKVTIKDVAREAGVSISTVSNALNGVDVLRPDTRRHILEVAERMNYVPNLNGRNLKSQFTKVIGLFLTSIKGTYYNVLVDSVYQECRKYGYELNIFVSERAENMMSNILGKRVDGAIILNKFIKEKETLLFQKTQIPVVFIDRKQQGEKITSVVFDSYHVGEMVAEYLLELGHHTFAYVNGAYDNYDNIKRLEGFRAGLDRAGMLLPEDCIINGAFEKETAYRSMKQFIKQFAQLKKELPEAVFAANDLSAIGAVEALMDSKIRVPEQVSVAGCDDIEIARLVRPSITTVRTSFEKQGMLAVKYLMGMITGEKKGCIDVLQGKIIPRDSTCVRRKPMAGGNLSETVQE